MSQPSALATPQPTQPLNWKRFFSLDNRYIAPMFITCILIAGHLSFGILESYKKTGIAIVASIVTELILGRIFTGKWPNIASAYITGISVGILVRSPAFWPYLLCAVISIMSKYVLRVKGRHIWNPSNFGISVLLFLAPAAVAGLSIQWGNYLLPMIVVWILGSITSRVCTVFTSPARTLHASLCLRSCEVFSPAIRGNRKLLRSQVRCISSSFFS